SPAEPVDHRQDGPGGRVLRASDAQFSGGRVGEEFDIFDALSQFIESSKAAPDDGAAILRRLDAGWATVKETHAQRVFEITYCPRNGRLRSCKALRRFMHTAELNHRNEDAHIVQLEAAFNAVPLVHAAPVISRSILPDRTIALPTHKRLLVNSTT